MNVQVRVKHDA